MHSQDYIIAQARMPQSEPAVSTTGKYCDKLGGLRPATIRNPLGCAPYRVTPGRNLPPEHDDTRKSERAAILAGIADNDSDIIPRTRNAGSDHPYLRQFTGALSFWRRMSNPPAELGTWAANDNLGDGLNAENQRERQSSDFIMSGNPRPMAAEAYLAMLPVPVRVSVSSARNRPDWKRPMPQRTLYEWHPDDADYVPVGGLQRISRLGGFEFATVDNATAKDKLTAPTVTKAGTARRYNVPLGSIVAYTQAGRRKIVTQDNARDRPEESEGALLAAQQSRDFYIRALTGPQGAPQEAREPRRLRTPRKAMPDTPATGPLPPITYCPPGLPYGVTDLSKLFWGIGSTAGGQKTGVHRPVEAGYAIWDARGDATAIARFRAANDNHAKVLDACMVAVNMTDIAAAVGKSSPHTGSAKLDAACSALRDFLDKNVG